jgi:alpha-beta hydrolase superfamily lysophospholipase
VNADLKWLQPLIDRYREAGLSRVSWHVYGNARHEVFNETNRDEVFANVIAWLNAIVGR